MCDSLKTSIIRSSKKVYIALNFKDIFMYIHIYILSKIFEAKIKYFSSYQLINIKGKYFSIFDDAKKVLPLLDFGLLRQ